MTVKVRDNGANRLLRNLKNAKRDRRVVDVGILGAKASENSKESPDKTVGEIAAYHEFGLGVPERPFLRGYVDAHKSEIRSKINSETRRMITAGATKAETLERIGIWMQGEIQAWIGNPGNDLLPNAPSTIIRKGSAMPLIKTGQLRSSVAYLVRHLGEGA